MFGHYWIDDCDNKIINKTPSIKLKEFIFMYEEEAKKVDFNL